MVMDVYTSKVPLVDSGSEFIAEFRLVVFRPFVGEVLSGRIMAATPVLLEFFDDIFIPAHLIFSTARL